VRQLVIKVLNIVDARCNHEVKNLTKFDKLIAHLFLYNSFMMSHYR